MTSVRPVALTDRDAWLRLRCLLWPEGPEQEHAQEIAEFFAGLALEPLAVLVAEESPGVLIGMAELSVRSHAEGCQTGQVAYLEGWYVVPDARRRGVGQALIRAAEEWGRARGCTEFASDTEVTNEVSAAAHKALGFAEVETIRCFRKNL